MKLSFALLVVVFSFSSAYSQQTVPDSVPRLEQFNRELLSLQANVDNIQLNLGKSERRFKTGIAVATLGYSVTIAGGLMLGRKHDDLGKALLVTGGAAGITGTFLLVDAFKFLGRASRKKNT